MQLSNSGTAYGVISKFFHWIIALAVISLLVVGFLLDSIPKGDAQNFAYMLHKSFGLTVLALMILRTLWTMSNEKPSLKALAYWERSLAGASHILFYLLLLLMPLSGWIMSTAAGYVPVLFGKWALPFPGIHKSELIAKWLAGVHKELAITIIVLLGLHILGALKHQFYDKKIKVISRMI